jgi:ABC-2 type transport system permease protein
MFSETLAICEKELRSIRHNPTDRLLRLVRPLLWLVLFGSVGASLFKLTGAAAKFGYQQFILPGIMINAVLATAVNYGIVLKWEADLGILSRMLVAPIRRGAIVLGKALASVVSSFVEIAILLGAAMILKVGFGENLVGSLLSAVVIVIFVIGAASLGMLLAILLRSKEAYVGIAALIPGPALFASNSLYNLDQMPTWLRLISLANPVTYAVDLIRRTLLYGNFEPFPLITDMFAVLLFSGLVLCLTSWLFQRMSS